MKILISSAGSHGDVLPAIALGKEFKRRGFEVVCYLNPYFERQVQDAQLRLVPIGTVDEYNRLFADPDARDLFKAFKWAAKYFADFNRLCYTAMLRDAVPGQTITIGITQVIAHRLLRELHDIPAATIHVCSASVRSLRDPTRFAPVWITAGTPMLVKRLFWLLTDRVFTDPVFSRPLNRIRAEHGLEPVARPMETWIHEADCTVGLYPSWFCPPQADWPSQLVLTDFPRDDAADDDSLPDAVARYIDAGAPPVVFTIGTATASAHDFYTVSAEVCRRMGRRGILLTQFPEQIPSRLPEGVAYFGFVPLASLLPKAAALVHHGGTGTTALALRAGTPQLIRPTVFDQFDNAVRARRLGVASEILASRYTVSNVTRKLERLLQDRAVAERCREVARIASAGHGARDACQIILDRLDAAPGGLPETHEMPA